MQYDRQIVISAAGDRRAARWPAQRMMLSEFYTRLSVPARGAETLEDAGDGDMRSGNVYRLGGNSCLSGDFMGYWRFLNGLDVGDSVIFEDMLHYTTVKTNMFNGITHPAVALAREDGTLEMLRVFGYEDYRSRMD